MPTACRTGRPTDETPTPNRTRISCHQRKTYVLRDKPQPLPGQQFTFCDSECPGLLCGDTLRYSRASTACTACNLSVQYLYCAGKLSSDAVTSNKANMGAQQSHHVHGDRYRARFAHLNEAGRPTAGRVLYPKRWENHRHGFATRVSIACLHRFHPFHVSAGDYICDDQCLSTK